MVSTTWKKVAAPSELTWCQRCLSPVNVSRWQRSPSRYGEPVWRGQAYNVKTPSGSAIPLFGPRPYRLLPERRTTSPPQSASPAPRCQSACHAPYLRRRQQRSQASSTRFWGGSPSSDHSRHLGSPACAAHDVLPGACNARAWIIYMFFYMWILMFL